MIEESYSLGVSHQTSLLQPAINQAMKIVGLIANAGGCMDAEGRATQEQLPNAFYAVFGCQVNSNWRIAGWLQI